MNMGLAPNYNVPMPGTHQAAADAKSAEWKVAIAAKLKAETSATNAWISERLSMGAPNAVSDYYGKYLKNRAKKCPLAKKLRTER